MLAILAASLMTQSSVNVDHINASGLDGGVLRGQVFSLDPSDDFTIKAYVAGSNSSFDFTSRLRAAPGLRCGPSWCMDIDQDGFNAYGQSCVPGLYQNVAYSGSIAGNVIRGNEDSAAGVNLRTGTKRTMAQGGQNSIFEQFCTNATKNTCEEQGRVSGSGEFITRGKPTVVSSDTTPWLMASDVGTFDELGAATITFGDAFAAAPRCFCAGSACQLIARSTTDAAFVGSPNAAFDWLCLGRR